MIFVLEALNFNSKKKLKKKKSLNKKKFIQSIFSDLNHI